MPPAQCVSAIILLTDGRRDHRPDPLDAARRPPTGHSASSRGIRHRQAAPSRSTAIDVMMFDEELIKAIAEITRASTSTPRPRASEEQLRRIDQPFRAAEGAHRVITALFAAAAAARPARLRRAVAALVHRVF